MNARHRVARQAGHINTLLIPLIACILLLLGAIGFGAWAFSGRQDFKNNVDQKITTAVDVAVEQTKSEDEARFAEEEKYPLKPYAGPSQFGSVRLEYPKTWSGYVINQDSGSTPVSWYLHPNVVPSVNERTNAFALRVEVVSTPYDRSLESFDSAVENGKAAVKPYKLPKVQDVIGARVDGEISGELQGSMVLLPLRNMTLKIWTESSRFQDDFDKIILPNVSFSP